MSFTTNIECRLVLGCESDRSVRWVSWWSWGDRDFQRWDVREFNDPSLTRLIMVVVQVQGAWLCRG
jgi:hypothetical protein